MSVPRRGASKLYHQSFHRWYNQICGCGGYQVIKKWLSYREYELLGRALTLDEIKEVTAMARRLAALVLLQPALDDNYRATIADAYAWPAA